MTAYTQQNNGIKSNAVEKVTRILVPKIGGKKVQIILKVPAERPTMATSQ